MTIMTIDDLNRIEASLDLILPPSYKAVALNHPDPQGEIGRWKLWSDPDRVIDENREVRTRGFFGLPWPHSWFVIGSDGSGCLFFMETAPSDGRVHYADFNDYDPEYAESEETHESIQKFLRG